MVWQYNVYALALFFAAALSGGLVLAMWSRRRRPGATPFVALLLLIAEWSLADGLEYTSADLSSILFWDKLAYLGLVSAPVACLIFVLYHTGHKKWLRQPTLSLLFLIPAVTLFLRWTDQAHHLIYTSYALATQYGVSVLQWTWGTWSYIDAAYSYILVIFAIALLSQQYSHSQGITRQQSLILILSVLLPLTTSVFMVLNIVAYPVDWASLGFAFTGFGLFWAVFRFRLFELLPVARAAVVRDISDGVIVFDSFDRLVDINTAGEAIFGSATRIFGRSATELFANLGMNGEHLAEGFSELKTTSAGHEQYFEVHFSYLHDQYGSLVGKVGVLRDITERKRMEAALRESEDRLRAVFESVNAGIMIIDPKKHVIVDANPLAIRMIGSTRDQVVGSVCHAFVCPAEEGYCPITDLGQHVDNSERTILRADGTTTSVLKSVTPIVYGAKQCLLESFIDITERKRVEETLVKTKRLAAVGEAAAMVGHDLRNPLQSTSSTLYLVRKLVGSGGIDERDEAMELLQDLDAQVYYMDKIVSDLQDYARPVDEDLIETSLPELIGEAVSGVKIPPAVRVSNGVQGDHPHAVVNPRLLSRVLVNLILNAIQAMPGGGNLNIVSQQIQDSAVITIQDSGVGISPENLEKIFNPFFTTKAQGQGLGLAVCKRLVQAQGGEITVQSSLGKGTTFTLKLPLNGVKEGD